MRLAFSMASGTISTPTAVLCVRRQRQRDSARTAVQVKHGLLAGQTGVVHRTRIQTLGLRVIDLIKRLGREQKRVPAQAVLQHRLTPENIRPVTQNHVVVALVVVEQNTRQRRRRRAQTLDQHIQFGHFLRRGNKRQLAFAAFFAHANVNMPNRTAFFLIIVRHDRKFRHPFTHHGGNLVRRFRLDEAFLHRHNVVAARTVKAGNDVALFVSVRPDTAPYCGNAQSSAHP